MTSSTSCASLVSDNETEQGLPDRQAWIKRTGTHYNKTRSQKKEELRGQVTIPLVALPFFRARVLIKVGRSVRLSCATNPFEPPALSLSSLRRSGFPWTSEFEMLYMEFPYDSSLYASLDSVCPCAVVACERLGIPIPVFVCGRR